MAEWTTNAETILSARYLKKDKIGKVIETPDEMIDRVARHVSLAEKSNPKKKKWYGEFLDIMDSLEFLPNSPTLMNAGKELGQLSACFVLPIEDDLSSIFETVKKVALIHKTGGGTGISLSKLRPANSIVDSTKGVASGPISFLRVFDVATDVIKQGGVRRGANMGILKVDHPDIFDFVTCKEDGKSFQNFNLSVAVTDKFLRAAKEDKQFPLVDPLTKNRRLIPAKDLFDLICYGAWRTGEPGVIFIDEINRKNPTPWLGRMECTNPCGEQPLLWYESCNLGSINLDKFIKNGKIDYQRLEEVVKIAVRFLDNIIDINKYPSIRIANKTKMTRKIGLGVMGWADALIKLGIPYDSEEALELANELMTFINEKAKEASVELAEEKGSYVDKAKIRNATRTTIAPTGTLSVLANCSSGIEPVFSKDFTKRVLGDIDLDLGSKYKKVPDKLMRTALLITPEAHIKMQATFQKHCDNAVSKTINLPDEASIEDVKSAVWLAWDLKCKGLTVYRHGTREGPLEISTEGLSECDTGKCEI
jgi:ribonucleoside-diphosphate reductase alpha chain